MMIAFITINSGLAHLIEGLCAQILELRCEIIGGLCGNETNYQQYCKRSLDAANLWTALEQGCGRQTLSASIVFFHTNY